VEQGARVGQEAQELKAVLPDKPPILTPEAAAVLLEMLRRAQERHDRDREGQHIGNAHGYPRP
jgi:hypothetical protein